MTITINTEDQKRQFAREAMEWLDSVPDDRHEWCDALIAGAIDECRGNLLQALEMAKAQYVETPEPPDEPYPTADSHTGDSSIPQGMAGHETYPDIPAPLPDNDPNEVPFKADRKNEQVDNDSESIESKSRQIVVRELAKESEDDADGIGVWINLREKVAQVDLRDWGNREIGHSIASQIGKLLGGSDRVKMVNEAAPPRGTGWVNLVK